MLRVFVAYLRKINDKITVFIRDVVVACKRRGKKITSVRNWLLILDLSCTSAYLSSLVTMETLNKYHETRHPVYFIMHYVILAYYHI